jgi:hypothetical protein
MKLEEKDYLKHLSEQIYFLIRSSEDFDKGYTMEAKRLASHIRTLVHDTKRSNSLLNQLNCKLDLAYFNTAIPESEFGLCGIYTTTDSGGKTMYKPPLNNLSELRLKNPWLTFHKWWYETKVLTDGQNVFSRKDLVLALANKDGGSHVDDTLSEPYVKLSRNNSLNVYHRSDSVHNEDVFGVELASVRQIAHELLISLKKQFPNNFVYSK